MENKNKESKILNKLKSNIIKPYQISAITKNEEKAAEIKRKYLEIKYNINKKLKYISQTNIDYSDAAKRNISGNLIGAVQIPLGFIEININGQFAKGHNLVFLATTEGRLVDGIARGASALNSKGVTTKILKDEMTRSIIIETNSLNNAYKSKKYIDESFIEIKKYFSKSSKYLILKNISSQVFGKLLFLRYGATTGAAMGMNMITIASHDATIKIIEKLNQKKINAKFFTESGNMCIDKKPGFINQILGRGISISAEAVIKKEIIKKYFKVNPSQIVKMNYYKNYIGSSLAGAIGNNAHIANVMSAIFIAYGQDIAQVVDSVSGYDNVELTESGDLYFSINLPSLEIGVYGGGTMRETQKELLIASKIYGENDEKGIKKYKFAELIAASVLAGELNLLSALAGQELSNSHASIKRG